MYNIHIPVELNVDGLILIGINIEDAFYEKISRLDIPIIFVNRHHPSVNYVTTDFFAGGTMATKYLINLGHKKIGFVSSPIDHPPTLEILEGYKNALILEGIEVSDELIQIESTYGDIAGYRAAESLMRLPSPPTAIFVSSHTMVLGVLRYLREHNYKVPEDIAIVGFDDDKSFSLVEPPITVIKQRSYDIGVTCAQSLVSLIENNKSSITQITLSPELLIRKSCGGGDSRGSIGFTFS